MEQRSVQARKGAGSLQRPDFLAILPQHVPSMTSCRRRHAGAEVCPLQVACQLCLLGPPAHLTAMSAAHTGLLAQPLPACIRAALYRNRCDGSSGAAIWPRPPVPQADCCADPTRQASYPTDRSGALAWLALAGAHSAAQWHCPTAWQWSTSLAGPAGWAWTGGGHCSCKWALDGLAGWRANARWWATRHWRASQRPTALALHA